MRVSLAGVVKSHGAHVVLDRVDVTLGQRSRLGVVGPNGAGKSTLLRLFAGLEEPDEGRVERTPPTLTAGYLPQEHDRRPGETLLAYLARRTGVAAAETEVRRHTTDWSPDATTDDCPPSIFRMRPLVPILAVWNGGTQALCRSPPVPASATYSLPSGPNVRPRGLSRPPMTTVRAPCASVTPA